MTILRGGGGSTNITYVATSAATENPRIQAHAIACLPGRREFDDGALDPEDECTTRSPVYRSIDGRPGGRSRGTETVSSHGVIRSMRPGITSKLRLCKITDLEARRDHHEHEIRIAGLQSGARPSSKRAG